MATTCLHALAIEVSSENKSACLNFSSKLAMYEFVRSVLHKAIYGGRQKEFYLLKHAGEMMIIDGGAYVSCQCAINNHLR